MAEYEQSKGLRWPKKNWKVYDETPISPVTCPGCGWPIKSGEKVTLNLGSESQAVRHAECQPAECVKDAEPQGNPDISQLGVYRLFWKSGGSSVATIGNLDNGTRWFAASNWTSEFPSGVASC